MKTIITAMGNKILNNELKKEKNIQLITEDIPYKEGILEILENNKNIDFLIFSEILPGEIQIKELIQKIKIINNNTQIILFLEDKNQELENYLYSKGINYIFYHNKTEISEIIQLIKKDDQDDNLQLKQEIELLKQLLLEKENTNNQKIIKNNNTNKSTNENIHNNINNINIINFINNIKNKKKETTINKNKQVICVSGTSGVGKSIFSINLAKSFMETKNKILIIDFDVLNNSLHTILGIKKYPEKIRNKIKNNNLLEEIKIEELIIKVNYNIDLISGINLIFDSKYKISYTKVKNILDKLKEKYDTIIIDTSSECFFDYTREIMKNSNINIFITEANILELEKAKKLLNFYINEWQIPQNKFNILFNKYNNKSIDISILKNIFSDFFILGKLSNSSLYNYLINKNDLNYLNTELKKEYFKINQNLLKEKSKIDNN